MSLCGRIHNISKTGFKEKQMDGYVDRKKNRQVDSQRVQDYLVIQPGLELVQPSLCLLSVIFQFYK